MLTVNRESVSFLVGILLTVPVALYGLLLPPDTPHNDFILSFEHRAYFMAMCSVALCISAGNTESFSVNALLNPYMQCHPVNKYIVAQKNNYPTDVPTVGIISALFLATLTDFLGVKRYLMSYCIGITGICMSIMVLAAAKNPESLLLTTVTFAAYY
ncbi:unnamed protein product [Clonostachys rhizophaga]|uniref:Uncharacterized protein n=1 Tax=Clonostachys rhizophaga TaxID=160324 RepID=A0A9N9VQI4_9HYPO|nr:unnamed protein product [Clonostachys rhizophaga]